jgi:hypothetical protein
MKLKKLDESLTTLQGQKIMVSRDKPMTYRDAFISSCEMHKANPGEGEAIKAYHIGMKFIEAKDEVELNDEEIKLLKKIVDSNESFVTIVVGRLTDYLTN